MKVEMIEMNAIVEVAKADDSFELLALSLDDLDLVGGGSTIGSVH